MVAIRKLRAVAWHLLQLRVLGFSFFQDGGIGIGALPEGEEIFVRRERAGPGGGGIRPLRQSTARLGASHSQMSQCSRPAIQTMPPWSRIF